MRTQLEGASSEQRLHRVQINRQVPVRPVSAWTGECLRDGALQSAKFLPKGAMHGTFGSPALCADQCTGRERVGVRICRAALVASIARRVFPAGLSLRGSIAAPRVATPGRGQSQGGTGKVKRASMFAVEGPDSASSPTSAVTHPESRIRGAPVLVQLSDEARNDRLPWELISRCTGTPQVRPRYPVDLF